MIKRKVLIFWEGFPVCGLLVSEISKCKDIELHLYATKPNVPFDDMSEQYNITVNEVIEQQALDIDPSVFDLIIITGWRHKNWLRLIKKAKVHQVSTCVVVDNNFRGSIKQILGAIYYRFFLKRYFDFAFCPGQEAKKLMRFLGVSENKIIIGNYGAHTNIYNNKYHNEKRNEFIFVGQLIERKGLLELLDAFHRFSDLDKNWCLRIIGNGELSDKVAQSINASPQIIFENFLQPDDVSIRLRDAKVFILPSRMEHWGTVVCEAAASGCALILSTSVGSLQDLLLNGVNGTVFESHDADDLLSSMVKLASQDTKWYKNAEFISSSLALARTEHSYYNAVRYMLNENNIER